MEVKAAEFKARCLKLLDQVATTRSSLIITKRGKAVAKVTAIDDAGRKTGFGYLKGNISIHGDVIHVPHDAMDAETGGEDYLYQGASASSEHHS